VSTVSFASTLDRVNLADILRRLELHEKTGLLVVKQGTLWVELYFSQGRLMCIGPVRAHLTLGDRLVQAGVISSGMLADVLTALKTRGEEPSETRIALLLMELGYASREQLRAWATREASRVIEVLLSWRNGDVYFVEGQLPPRARLLVSLSPSALLPAAPATPLVQLSPSLPPQPAPSSSLPEQTAWPAQQAQQPQQLITEGLFAPPAQAPAPQPQPRITQSLPETASSGQGHIDASSLFDPSALARLSAAAASAPTPEASAQPTPGPAMTPTLPPPRPLTVPYVPRRIDISFLHPDMLLMPTDLSPLRSGQVEIPLTPDEWRVFSCVNGQTSLQMAARRLGMPFEQVCVVAAELIALGLVQPPQMPQPQLPLQELSPAARSAMASAAGAFPAGSAPQPPARNSQPLSPGAPAVPPSPVYVETESQWGNGGNGAKFVVGRGWGVQPTSPLQTGQRAQAPSPNSVPIGGA
jgi:hypothetical protein